MLWYDELAYPCCTCRFAFGVTFCTVNRGFSVFLLAVAVVFFGIGAFLQAELRKQIDNALDGKHDVAQRTCQYLLADILILTPESQANNDDVYKRFAGAASL